MSALEFSHVNLDYGRYELFPYKRPPFAVTTHFCLCQIFVLYMSIHGKSGYGTKLSMSSYTERSI
jgi:hypothetical protein